MRIQIRQVKPQTALLCSVLALGKSQRALLGFLPEGAFDQGARDGHILAALDSQSRFLGYVLYRIARNRAVIVHMCVDLASRPGGVASRLCEEVSARTQQFLGIELSCRSDYAANDLWPELGFTLRGHRPGRGKSRKTLNIWWFDHGHPTLFAEAEQRRASKRHRVVIDTNVFLDLIEDEADRRPESQVLLADWMSEFELCVRMPSSRAHGPLSGQAATETPVGFGFHGFRRPGHLPLTG